MTADIEQITVNYEEDGIPVIKELDKIILSKGAWSTILFKYRQWDKSKQDYGPVKFTIRRYRKINDSYRQQSKFTISSPDQAKKIIDCLQKWLNEPDKDRI